MSHGQNLERPILALSFPFCDAEIVIKGMDELELEAIRAAVCGEDPQDASVAVGKAKVILLETIRKTAEGEGKYIRQTGGSGSYGHVKLRLEPALEGSGFEFVNALSEAALPKEYAVATERGVHDAARSGVLFGYEVTSVKVTLIDASFHAVDSNPMAFQIAGSMAFKEAARSALPVLLEPVMAVELLASLSGITETVSELNARRARIESMEPDGASLQIKAVVPLSEMLSSSEHGRPDYEMQFARYEPTRHPPEGSGQEGAGVIANLPKHPHSGHRSAAVQPVIEFD